MCRSAHCDVGLHSLQLSQRVADKRQPLISPGYELLHAGIRVRIRDT
jgi:hypothetical protein